MSSQPSAPSTELPHSRRPLAELPLGSTHPELLLTTDAVKKLSDLLGLSEDDFLKLDAMGVANACEGRLKALALTGERGVADFASLYQEARDHGFVIRKIEEYLPPPKARDTTESSPSFRALASAKGATG